MENPKIRFKGFTKDWEQRKLGEILEYEQPGPYIVDSTDYDNSYSTPVLTAGQSFILGYTNETAGIKKATPDNPVIIFDDFTTSSHYVDFSFKVKSSAMKFLTLKNDTDDIYCINNVLENIDYIPASHERHWISIFTNFDVRVPSSREEQKSIGDYFRNLDTLIALHQRKCEQTKKMKKYMLQKMFPQNGAKVPEIRFDGFTYDWEQRKFSEFVENVAVRNREGLELECYAVTNDRGFISQKEAHDDFGYMADVDKTAYNIVPPNSFAYNPARINVGSIGYYAGTENVIVSSLYEVFQTADYVEDGFLWHWFKSTHFPKWIERLQEGSVRLYFYYDKLIQCEMKMPSLEEQKKIGKYFDNLDHLITLHQRQHKLHLNMLL